MKSINIITIIVLSIVFSFTSVSFAGSKISKSNRFPTELVQEVLETPPNVDYRGHKVQDVNILKKSIIKENDYKKYVGKKASRSGNKFAARTNRLLYSGAMDDCMETEIMIVVYTVDLISSGIVKPVVAITVFYSILNTNTNKYKVMKTNIKLELIKSQKQHDEVVSEYLKQLDILTHKS